MKQIQRGFTLIELVMVIVVLGILAAVALPKFVDLSSSANAAAVAGVAGAYSSGSSVNYATRALTTAQGAKVISGTACNDATVLAALLQGGLPTGYSVAGTASTNANSCTVSGPGTSPATAAATLLITTQ